MAETEQNKTEQATPFKLKRAREKGAVARGADLGYLSVLLGLALFVLTAGRHAFFVLTESMRRALLSISDVTRDAHAGPPLVALTLSPALQIVPLLAVTVVLAVALFEIIQVRGLHFTMHPLRPDFNRLNPMTGLKRLFSPRMLKEALKNTVKLAVYSTAAFLVLRQAFEHNIHAPPDVRIFLSALQVGGLQLLLTFAFLAAMFAAIDQMLARAEFSKQMRMSKSELTREVKEREGEPRLKQRRKQLHAEFAKQTRNLGDLAGSDMLIVNPDHYAVGLAYVAARMNAPVVTAKGRNHFALFLKRKAAQLSIVVFEQPALARSLYRSSEKGEEISAKEYRAVAELYLKIARARRDAGADA